MVYFTTIKKTKHYEEQHEQNVPWSEVVEVIFKSSKRIRKKATNMRLKQRIAIF